MKLPRKLKKKLTKEYGGDIVNNIISGVLEYKSKDTAHLTGNGWKVVYGKKCLFMRIYN